MLIGVLMTSQFTGDSVIEHHQRTKTAFSLECHFLCLPIKKEDSVILLVGFLLAPAIS